MIVTRSLVRVSGVELFMQYDDGGQRSDVRVFTTGAEGKTITVTATDQSDSSRLATVTLTGNLDTTINNRQLSFIENKVVGPDPKISFTLSV